MIIELPTKMKKENIPKITHEVFDDNLKPKSDYFEFDFSKVDFIEPGGVVALCNLISLLKAKGVKGVLKLGKQPYNDKHKKVLNYLADSYFFIKKFDIAAVREPVFSQTVLTIEEINFSRFFSWKDQRLDLWLKNNTKTRSSFTNIRTVMDEIYNNIKDHSTEDVGCVFGQFYPNKNEIILCISDFGIGIPASLRNLYPELTDSQLLEKSLEEGVTTRTTPRNRGAGLHTIINSATKNRVGEVYIMSNYGIIEVVNEKVISSKDTNKFYPGTFFEIKIDITNPNLYESETEEDFEWSF